MTDRDTTPLLAIEDLHYSTGKKEILSGVNLSVGKGEIHTILGVNGTGKTTLAAVLMGLGGFRPTSGRIIFDGRDITNLSIPERAKLGITLAFQRPANFEGITVRQYLSLSNKGITPDEALQVVGLRPDLYLNRVVDESLSGGERKRIELASVFTIKPGLVILDEPDSGIDITSIEYIKKAVRIFRENGASVILITHSEQMAAMADRASLMCSGIVIKVGGPEEVRKFFRDECRGCDHIGEIKEVTA